MALAACGCGTYAAEPTDSVSLENVTVTGVRSAADVRQLPFTVTTISKEVLNENYRQNILPTLTEHVPGLMVASRGVLGYGVSTGAAGGMTMRGLSSGAGQMMVLIDGHPQYNGVYGHSIASIQYGSRATKHLYPFSHHAVIAVCNAVAIYSIILWMTIYKHHHLSCST